LRLSHWFSLSLFSSAKFPPSGGQLARAYLPDTQNRCDQSRRDADHTKPEQESDQQILD
jgi:hypothetical protein